MVTHRAASPPSTAREASTFLTGLVAEGAVQIWAPRAGFATRLLQLGSDLDVSGARVFALLIALTASGRGAVATKRLAPAAQAASRGCTSRAIVSES